MIYYGEVDTENHGYGFVLEDDPRRQDDFIALTDEEHQELMDKQCEGLEIVCYDGKVFNAEHGLYYQDEQGVWCKKSDEEFNKEKSDKKRIELINTIYEIKAEKAYGGVVINNMLVFETNQTAITNTVASLALMSDTATTSWKFYTVNNEPYVQSITKAQLAFIATFGQNMINQCFTLEGKYNELLKSATVENLLDTKWVEKFVQDVKTEMAKVENNVTVKFA